MRSHVGFDELWSMRIPVPYSLLLRSGDLGWSCGQCPLDRDGAVVAPGDAMAQARVVGELARTVLERGGFRTDDLTMAVVYTTVADHALVLRRLRDALGCRIMIVPVVVPEFYYPGMEIELDLFVSHGARQSPERAEGPGWAGQGVTVGGLRFIMAELGPGADVANLRDTLLLDGALVEHWCHPGTANLPDHAVIGQTGIMWAVTAGGGITETRQIRATRITTRQTDGWLSLTGIAPAVAGLVPQTEAIMQAIADTLQDQGLGFADVVKSTTHYVGDPTPADLHANMEVRNRRYTSPGPASTGIRVHALAAPGALTAISLLVQRPPLALQSAGESV